ncbi:MAG: hypothetical protein HY914_19025 [Desulfomonile tiedjei]|nr:hypothetical protein [Desulfomonile tiedjei]
METARTLARIIGPIQVIAAIGLVLNRETGQRLIEEFSKSASLCYLGGFMALLLGLVILEFHHTWEARWPVIITLMGWLSVVKGVALVAFPGATVSLWHPLLGTTTPLLVAAAIHLVVGAFLTVKGYWG